MKIFKALVLTLIGLIIWSILVYVGIAFIIGEFNPFIWEEVSRVIMVYFILFYVVSIPLIMYEIKN